MQKLAAFTVVGLLALPTLAPAQHPATSASPSLQAESCGLCHSTHEGAPASAGLITGTDHGQERWLEMQAPGAGPISLSCLRCHLTPGERMRQGEFAQAAPTSAGPTFLGMELGDDHPLGSLERFSASPRLDLSDPRRMRPLDLTLSGRRGVIECTTCHDPHDRVSTKPDAIEQRQICSVCHDPATYEYEGHTEQACSDCHALHGGAIGVLLAEQDPSRLCGRCHLSLAPPSTLEEARRNPARTPPAPMPGDEHVPGADCLGCHTAHKR